jgi:hypothetical protein
MDLTVIVDSNDAHDGNGGVIAGEQHDARHDPCWITSVGERRPTEPLVILGVEVSYEVDVVHTGSKSGFIIGVHNFAVITPAQPLDPVIEIVEHNVEVTRISVGRFDSESRSTKCANLRQRKNAESNEWRLLREFVDRGVAQGED